MNVIERIDEIMEKQNLTDYQLSKLSGLSTSTISNMRKRNTIPSVATLEYICDALQITLSQFFADADMVELTPNLKELFDCWACLTPSQKAAALQMRKAMRCDNDS